MDSKAINHQLADWPKEERFLRFVYKYFLELMNIEIPRKLKGKK